MTLRGRSIRLPRGLSIAVPASIRSTRRLRIRVADSLPKTLEGVGPRLRAQAAIGAQSFPDSLNDVFPDVVGAGLPLPVVKHLRQPANYGGVVIALLAFEPEKLAKLLKR